MSTKIIKMYMDKNRYYTNPKIIKPTGLMLHSVACSQPYADVFIRSWNNPACTKGVHAFVQGDGEIYQALPWNYRGGHAGGKANNTHIGVEMTEPDTIHYTSGATFYDRDPAHSREHVRTAYHTAVKLFSHLCVLFSIDPMTGIISHSEGHAKGLASDHGDPEHLWAHYPDLGYNMNKFRADVLKEVEKVSKNAEPHDYHKAACNYAIEHKIFIGDEDGNYHWNEPVTREELAQVIYNMRKGGV